MEKEIIENYLEEQTRKENSESENLSDRLNAMPCKVCNANEFVQKFRNVVGEIEGSMTGHFSLFGGSVSGYISGSTRTLPVLSCRKCGNEREIDTWDYKDEKDIFWDDMRNFYFGIDKKNLYRFIKQIYLDNPKATRAYMLENPNYKYDFYNEIAQWPTKVWVKAGFNIKKIKKHFLFWEWEVLPSWNNIK